MLSPLDLTAAYEEESNDADIYRLEAFNSF